MTEKKFWPARYGFQYGYYNNRECFPVQGPGIHEYEGMMKFASPEIAERMCGILQSVWQHGYDQAKAEVRATIGIDRGPYDPNMPANKLQSDELTELSLRMARENL